MSSSSVPVSIVAADGCSELYLENHSYVLVASGMGTLSTQVPPGLYKIRQRIGDIERSAVLDVVVDQKDVHLRLAPIEFASPIPLLGTTTSRDFQMDAMRAAGLGHTTTGKGTTELTILVRDSQWEYGQPNIERSRTLRREVGRLRIESFDGTYVRELRELESPDAAGGFLSIALELEPGPYVLSQCAGDGTRRCMALIARRNWALHIFLQVPPVSASEVEDATLELDRAAVVYARPGVELGPSDHLLLLLETARAAFSRRRGEVADSLVDQILNGKYETPVLGLFGAYLLLSAPQVDAGRLQRVVDNTAHLLGEDFPDIIALRIRLLAVGGQTLVQLPVTAPPLLALSWNVLTQAEKGVPAFTHVAVANASAELAGLFAFPFSTQSSSTWFVWTEAHDARILVPKVDFASLGFTRGLTVSPRAIEFETPPTMDSLRDLLQRLLSAPSLTTWVRSLKAAERSGSASIIAPFDRSLLGSVASAQTTVIPGIIDQDWVVEKLLDSLTMPVATAQKSASTLLYELKQWNAKQKPAGSGEMNLGSAP